MKNILIKQGKHMASNQFTKIRSRWFGSGKLYAIVKFDDSCRYDIGDDQKDWNKLYGCSWGFNPLFKQFTMHENSSRWGWRYNKETDRIELAPYYYINGLRYYPEITGSEILSIELGEEIAIGIVPINQKECIYTYTHVYSYTDKYNDLIMYSPTILHRVEQKIPSIGGFLAPVYFGGNKPAPHDIKIEISISQ